MAEIMVREMREEDIDGIMEIEHGSFAIPWTKQDLIGELSNTAARYFVLLEDGVVSAYAGTWLIIDEAQNLTPRQVKGIVTRVGKGTKVVLLGDPAQIDHPLLDTRSNGLTYASARMRGSPLCAQLTMLPDECERSSLALDAAVRM